MMDLAMKLQQLTAPERVEAGSLESMGELKVPTHQYQLTRQGAHACRSQTRSHNILSLIRLHDVS